MNKRKSNKMKNVKKSDIYFSVIFGFILLIFAVITLYPFYLALIYSFSNGTTVLTKNVVFLPVDFTLDNYKMVLANSKIVRATLISIARTVLGTLVFLLVTGLSAYAMSKSKLPGRKLFFIFYLIPMYISGGLLPYYVLLAKTGFTNNFLVYILPPAFSGFFMLIMKAYFEGIPAEISESAFVDGAGELIIFFRLILPLSAPIFATAALFNIVSQWNSWFDAMLFVTNSKLHPLQFLLQMVLMESQMTEFRQVAEMFYKMKTGEVRKYSVTTLRMATLMVTVLPIMFVYPFFQKHFTKGMLLGSIKL